MVPWFYIHIPGKALTAVMNIALDTCKVARSYRFPMFEFQISKSTAIAPMVAESCVTKNNGDRDFSQSPTIVHVCIVPAIYLHVFGMLLPLTLHFDLIRSTKDKMRQDASNLSERNCLNHIIVSLKRRIENQISMS